MAKTQSTELPKDGASVGDNAQATGKPTGPPAQDDRQAVETAAGRHEGDKPPQHKTN